MDPHDLDNFYYIPCAYCGEELTVQRKGDTVLPIGGKLAINIPAMVCSNCIDDQLDFIVAMVCVNEITEDMAEKIIQNCTIKGALFLVDLFKTSARVYDLAAVKLYSEGYRKEAHKLIDRGTKISDNPDKLLCEKAAFLSIEGKYKDAYKKIKLVKDINIDNYYVVKGNILKNLGRWDEAAECWRLELSRKPHHWLSMNNLGYYLSKIKKDDLAAEDHYTEACKLFPDHRPFFAYLGDSLFFQGRKGEALKYYQKALSMPDDEWSMQFSDQLTEDIQRAMRACKD